MLLMLRVQLAIACGALVSAAVLAERWRNDPERIGRGCVLAALGGLAAAGASLL